jgi:phosphoacetylglucosamine mutase
VHSIDEEMATHADSVSESTQVWVDCAGGIGSLPVLKLRSLLRSDVVDLQVINGGLRSDADGHSSAISARLNDGCGSDFVQRTRSRPANMPVDLPTDAVCCSVDGDADRILFFMPTESAQRHNALLKVLDGDYIAALLASFFTTILGRAQAPTNLTLGVLPQHVVPAQIHVWLRAAAD